MRTFILLVFTVLFATSAFPLTLPTFDDFISRCNALNNAVYDTVTDMCYTFQPQVTPNDSNAHSAERVPFLMQRNATISASAYSK